MIFVFCLVLFGYSLVGGRPLTMHEAVVPQSAREMMADHDWAIPKSGGRPWLERPPLPQWITIAIAALIGRCDSVAIVRIPPALAACAIVLMTARMADRWFGRAMAWMSALVTATLFELTSYAWLAEPDIFLGALVTAAIAVFVVLEVTRSAGDSPRRASFLGGREWAVWALFFLLGATNLAKGLLFGWVIAVLPMAAFLLGTRQTRRIDRYVWLWGWLLMLGIALTWPAIVLMRHPDVIELWLYDLVGRLDGSYSAINQSGVYYLEVMLWILAPWTPFAIVGLATSARTAWTQAGSPERFLWCWAVLPVVLLSFPSGKHHHYLIPCLPAWGMLSALGLRTAWMSVVSAWRRRQPAFAAGVVALAVPGLIVLAVAAPHLPVPGWLVAGMFVFWPIVAAFSIACVAFNRGSWAMACAVAIIAVVYAALYSLVLPERDQCRDDTQFFVATRATRDPNIPLFVNASLGSMDVFRILFYLDSSAIALHDLSFLRDERWRSASAYVLTRRRDVVQLRDFGNVQEVASSRRSRRESGPEDRFALYLLQFRSDLIREAVARPVSPMEAMSRR